MTGARAHARLAYPSLAHDRRSCDVPRGSAAVSLNGAVPHPAADMGGLEDLPPELMPERDRYEDEADHAALDEPA